MLHIMDKNDRMTKWEFIRPKEYGSELGHTMKLPMSLIIINPISDLE